jgi:hypothetical protein
MCSGREAVAAPLVGDIFVVSSDTDIVLRLKGYVYLIAIFKLFLSVKPDLNTFESLLFTMDPINSSQVQFSYQKFCFQNISAPVERQNIILDTPPYSSKFSDRLHLYSGSWNSRVVLIFFLIFIL